MVERNSWLTIPKSTSFTRGDSSFEGWIFKWIFNCWVNCSWKAKSLRGKAWKSRWIWKFVFVVPQVVGFHAALAAELGVQIPTVSSLTEVASSVSPRLVTQICYLGCFAIHLLTALCKIVDCRHVLSGILTLFGLPLEGELVPKYGSQIFHALCV